jgi:hypothetical protein
MAEYDGNAPDAKDTKPSNPKDAAAFGKRIAWSVLPIRALIGPALALAEGAWKYGRHNYRPAGVRASVYFDAVLRHLFAWWEGQDTDPASRLNHVDKAIAGLLVLRDSMLEGNWIDDRPPRVTVDFIAQANEMYEALAERMREENGPARAPFTQIARPSEIPPPPLSEGDARWPVDGDGSREPTPVERVERVRELRTTDDKPVAMPTEAAAPEAMSYKSSLASATAMSYEASTALARAKLVRPCTYMHNCVKEALPNYPFCEGRCKDVYGKYPRS